MKEDLKVIISGGGTGGHIFPAISIANAIKEQRRTAKILFVGAEGKMEMQKVPAAGYEIIGLPICGFDRSHLLRNVKVLCKLLNSQLKAYRIIKRFGPHVVVGVGGYASAPTLKIAELMKIPTLLQEQNSYAGITNKWLSRNAKRICVAYEGMESFFEKDKIVLTGNPVRQNLLNCKINKQKAIQSFGLDPAKKVVLVLGGSLGARTINQCVLEHLDKLKTSDVQFIWQTGKIYIHKALEAVNRYGDLPMLYITDFISNMEEAYVAADLVISRAGACSISELCLLKKPVILVPSPNVAEDHQTKNALSLVKKQAALYVKDCEASDYLIDIAIEVVSQEEKLKKLSENIYKLAFPDSATVIAQEVCNLADKYKEEHGY